jgi:hypothetical protein
MYSGVALLTGTTHASAYPKNKIFFWNYNPVSDCQRRKIFLMDQLVAGRDRDPQCFCHCIRVKEQRQLIITFVDRFFRLPYTSRFLLSQINSISLLQVEMIIILGDRLDRPPYSSSAPSLSHPRESSDEQQFAALAFHMMSLPALVSTAYFIPLT